MKVGQISRSIPATYRSQILEMVADIEKWPGYRKIVARLEESKIIGISYLGQGGHISLKLEMNDDFSNKLRAIEKKITEDKNFMRVQASLILDKERGNLGADGIFRGDHNFIAPTWVWNVPTSLRCAYEKKYNAKINTYFDEDESFGGDLRVKEEMTIQIQPNSKALGKPKERLIEKFIIREERFHLSCCSTTNYLFVKNIDLPESVIAELTRSPSRPIGEVVSHALIDPENLIQQIKIEKGGVTFMLWRYRAPLSDPPVQKLDDVIKLVGAR